MGLARELREGHPFWSDTALSLFVFVKLSVVTLGTIDPNSVMVWVCVCVGGCVCVWMWVCRACVCESAPGRDQVASRMAEPQRVPCSNSLVHERACKLV